MQQFSHETMLSPFTWRYGSEAMRHLWSEVYTRKLWRRLWVALAEAQHAAGLVSRAQLEDLRAHQDAVNIERAHQIEAEIKHDLMAEVKCYAEQCPVGGGIIHLGATSMDIEDNATALRMREGLALLIQHLGRLLEALAGRIEAEAHHVCIAFTHLQPAAPTTVGYRLANYAQDFLAALHHLRRLHAEIRGKGFKGAVGTGATYSDLLRGTDTTAAALESAVMAGIDLPAFPIASQVYPRRQDWLILTALADVAMTAHRMAFDIRVLQSPPIGEWMEPFGAQQVGSSAMPFKRNPINAENIDSLARYVASLVQVAWGNAADNLLERTLDDSANRRAILPEGFLACEEVLMRAARVIDGLKINRAAVARNLAIYGGFAATERILMEGVRAGGDRQVLHEVIREHSLAAWAAVQEGGPNTLAEGLAGDARITALISAERLHTLMRADDFVGDAPARALAFSATLRMALKG